MVKPDCCQSKVLEQSASPGRSVAGFLVAPVLWMIVGWIPCVIVAVGLIGAGGVKETAAGACVAVPAMFFSLLFIMRHGTDLFVILGVTFMRVLMTLFLSGFVAWKFPSLRTPAFFITVTVVYLVGLFVETRLVYLDHLAASQRSLKRSTSD